MYTKIKYIVTKCRTSIFSILKAMHLQSNKKTAKIYYKTRFRNVNVSKAGQTVCNTQFT